MTEGLVDQLVAGGWLYAALRIAFIGLIYLFLFLVLRATVRELHAAARAMPSGEGRASTFAVVVRDAAASSLAPGETIALAPKTTIGRATGNTLRVDDPHTSASHAALWYERGQWWLRDLGSSNGTLLNDVAIRTVVGVRAGDVIQCGRVRFQLVPSIAVPGEDASA
jgi:hypothetical protein